MQMNAQEYLIRQFPDLDTIEKEYGANLTNYNAMIYGFGVHFGPTDSSGSDINSARSFYFTYGGRHKYKITSTYNLGIDYFFEYRNFGIAQSSSKVFASTIEHSKERYSQITFNIGLFNRFNLSKRGNHLGKYIDVFITGIYSPFNRYYTFDKTNGGGSKYIKQVYSKLEFANKLFAQVGLRYGISFFQFQAFYRPLDMFKKTNLFPYPELPRFGAGIIIDIEDFYNNN
jgi:hypothetical protein